MIEHQQRAIDLGIVVTDSARALGFYRDLLGFVHEGDMPTPIGGRGTMHRLRCGGSLIKLVALDTVPEARPASKSATSCGATDRPDSSSTASSKPSNCSINTPATIG